MNLRHDSTARFPARLLGRALLDSTVSASSTKSNSRCSRGSSHPRPLGPESWASPPGVSIISGHISGFRPSHPPRRGLYTLQGRGCFRGLATQRLLPQGPGRGFRRRLRPAPGSGWTARPGVSFQGGAGGHGFAVLHARGWARSRGYAQAPGARPAVSGFYGKRPHGGDLAVASCSGSSLKSLTGRGPPAGDTASGPEGREAAADRQLPTTSATSSSVYSSCESETKHKSRRLTDDLFGISESSLLASPLARQMAGSSHSAFKHP